MLGLGRVGGLPTVYPRNILGDGGGSPQHSGGMGRAWLRCQHALYAFNKYDKQGLLLGIEPEQTPCPLGAYLLFC